MLQVFQKCNGNLCGKKQRRVGKNVSSVGVRGGGGGGLCTSECILLCGLVCMFMCGFVSSLGPYEMGRHK